jgi:hypothetical protein
MRLNITNCVLLLNNQIERPAVHNMFICTKLHHCEWVTIRVPLYPLFKGPPPLLTLAKDMYTYHTSESSQSTPRDRERGTTPRVDCPGFNRGRTCGVESQS